MRYEITNIKKSDLNYEGERITLRAINPYRTTKYQEWRNPGKIEFVINKEGINSDEDGNKYIE